MVYIQMVMVIKTPYHCAAEHCYYRIWVDGLIAAGSGHFVVVCPEITGRVTITASACIQRVLRSVSHCTCHQPPVAVITVWVLMLRTTKTYWTTAPSAQI